MDCIQDHNLRLLRQYDSVSSDLSLLLVALRDELLPQLAIHLKLADNDITWLSEWLSDTASIFRLLKRHHFSRALAMQEIRNISIWRIRVLRHVIFLPKSTLLHCLPPPITDPSGHPILFLKFASLQTLSCSAKGALFQEVECLRLHLRYIRDHGAYSGSFPLQYLLLVDLENVPIQNPNLDLFLLLTEIISRYPGMLAAIFLINYSWIHSGAWLVARRLLPSSAIARVFFPSKAQLLNYCSAESLPAEYGGSLPSLDQIDDALRSPYQTHHLPPPPPPPDPPVTPTFPPWIPGENPSSNVPPTLEAHRAPSTIFLSPFSPRNPFFGYPAIASASSPHTIRHVRRGLLELVRTLAVLWWRRWGRWVLAWTYSVGACGLLWIFLRRVRQVNVRTLIGIVQQMRK